MGFNETTSLFWPDTNTTAELPVSLQPNNNHLIQRALSVTLTVVVSITMTGVGCGVDVRQLKVHFVRPVGIIVGFVCQFVIMPLVALALAKIAHMEDIETLGLLFLGSCPGGTFSNIATYWAKGDLGLSIAMTTVSNTLGLGTMPLLLFIYSFAFDSTLAVPFQTIGLTLLGFLLPTIVGMAIRFKWPEVAKKAIKVLSVMGSIAILSLFIPLLITYGGSLRLTPAQIGCAAVFPVIGMILGYALSSLANVIPKINLEHKQRRTICFETGIQNTQMAGAIINLSFPLVQIVRIVIFPLAYLISQLSWVILFLVSYRIYFRIVSNRSNADRTLNDDEEKSGASDDGKINSAFHSDPPAYTDTTDDSHDAVSKL